MIYNEGEGRVKHGESKVETRPSSLHASCVSDEQLPLPRGLQERLLLFRKLFFFVVLPRHGIGWASQRAVLD